jgi:hypothetical protein
MLTRYALVTVSYALEYGIDNAILAVLRVDLQVDI